MGNWNRRYVPRRKFRHYECDDPPLSPPRPHDNNSSYSSRVVDKRATSWEMDYCNLARVPWHKVLASKKYIYCYPNVLNWNASAGEEALQNAKRRYWAMISGLPCDDPLPDPDIYIDEIDWNPSLDPELMADLDLQRFDPDQAQNFEKLETIDEGAECAQSQYDKNQNPWEQDYVQGTGSVKDVGQGWSRWEDTDLKIDNNPWDQSCSQRVGSLKDNVWKSGNNESWGWHKGIDKSSAFVNNESGSYIRQEGWGQWENNSSDWGRGINNNNGNRNESWNQRESGYQGNEPKYWDSRSFRRGGRSFRGGCRKREGFQQHGLKFKSSRYHGDNTYGDNHQF